MGTVRTSGNIELGKGQAQWQYQYQNFKSGRQLGEANKILGGKDILRTEHEGRNAVGGVYGPAQWSLVGVQGETPRSTEF